MREIARTITDPLGLHIQLAVLLAGEAERWRSRVTLTHAGRTVDAKQLMELLILGVRTGERVTVQVDGPDEATAAEVLKQLIQTF